MREIGNTPRNTVEEKFKCQHQFEKNQLLLSNYFKWLATNGFKLPEDPIHKGKVFFVQLEFEAGISPGCLTAKKGESEKSNRTVLRRMVEKMITSLGMEVRVLSQNSGQRLSPISYEHMLDIGSKERSQELEGRSSSKQQLYNTRSALNRFIKSLKLEKKTIIGKEFIIDFQVNFEKVLSHIKNASTRKKIQTEMNWWCDCYQRLVKEPTIPEGFREALIFLIDRSGLSFTVLTKLIGLSHETLSHWYRGVNSPSVHCLDAIARLENLFKLPAGTLVNRIPSGSLRKSHRFSELPDFLKRPLAKVR